MYATTKTNEVIFEEDQDGVGKEFPITDLEVPLPPIDSAVPASSIMTWLNDTMRENYPIRIFSQRRSHAPIQPKQGMLTPPLPFSSEVISSVAVKSEIEYRTLWHTQVGGSIVQTVMSQIFLQTPSDGGPFCSFATSVRCTGAPVRGFYVYTDDSYELSKVLPGTYNYSGYRGWGFHLLCLPTAFLKVHVAWMEQQMGAVSQKINEVEDEVSEPRDPDDDRLDFGAMTRKLHDCSTTIFNLERRARFELNVVKTLDVAVNSMRGRTGMNKMLTDSIDALRPMIDSNIAELRALPARIEAQRNMIFNLIVQRDQRLNIHIGRTNLEIAETSRQIAEASMSDSASMKTIAILTMVFLPGTAVASFFSMTMFNWNVGGGNSNNSSGTSNGNNIASSYIWVYFVTAVPLTLMVMATWWFCLQRRKQQQRNKLGLEGYALASRSPTGIGTRANDQRGQERGREGAAGFGTTSPDSLHNDVKPR